MKQYILAHDLGTSGNKATLYRIDSMLIASALVSYPTLYPSPGFVEQNAEDWWKSVCEATKRLLEKTAVRPEEIACMSFSGQMMGCLLVDRQGNPLRPSIIWADTRAAAEEEAILNAVGMENMYHITGHRVSASYSAAKLLWIRRHEPDVYRNGYKMLQAKDFIVYRLTGIFATDYSDASGTNLFDLSRKCWSKDILKALDIPQSILPDLFPSTHVVGGVLPQAATETGLMAGTPVVLGGGDGSCACVGAGVVEEGSSYCVLGSSSWISSASRHPVFDEQIRTFNWVHLDPNLYTPCGTMQAAGYSYNWYRNTLCTDEMQQAQKTGGSAYSLIDQDAAASPPGAGGVLYLPYLLGERSPRWNLAARGAFLGLSVTTTKGDLSRAVMEGVGMNLKIILDILDQDLHSEALTLIGGGAKGAMWLQILADIFEKPVRVPAHPEEASSMGAAVCAGVGAGIYPDFCVVHTFDQIQKTYMPNMEAVEKYQKLYPIFNEAYDSLCSVYHSLADYRKAEKV